MRKFQGSFDYSHISLLANNANLRFDLLIIICYLHQVHVQLVGISYIRSIYMPIRLEDNNQMEIWLN